jgi:putative transposase
VVHPANVQDRDGAKLLLRRARTVVQTLEKVFADGGYAGKLIERVSTHCNTTLEVVKRTDPHKFVVLAKRWIVERTFAWIAKARRLAREYETLPKSEEGMIYIAMIHVMLRRVI